MQSAQRDRRFRLTPTLTTRLPSSVDQFRQTNYLTLRLRGLRFEIIVEGPATILAHGDVVDGITVPREKMHRPEEADAIEAECAELLALVEAKERVDVYDEQAKAWTPGTVVVPRGKVTLVVPFPTMHGTDLEWRRFVGAFAVSYGDAERSSTVTFHADTSSREPDPHPDVARGVARVLPRGVRGTTRVILDVRDRILAAVRGRFDLTHEVELGDTGRVEHHEMRFHPDVGISPRRRRVLELLRLVKPLPVPSQSDGVGGEVQA